MDEMNDEQVDVVTSEQIARWTRPAQNLTVNQIVALNLARARRSRGWTQDEAAHQLKLLSLSSWTGATLGAAERSAKGGRIREFNANELALFSLVFGQPVSYFLVPPAPKEGEQIYVAFSVFGKEARASVDMLSYLNKAIPFSFTAQIVDSVNEAIEGTGMRWLPGEAEMRWATPLADQASRDLGSHLPGGDELGERHWLDQQVRDLIQSIEDHRSKLRENKEQIDESIKMMDELRGPATELANKRAITLAHTILEALRDQGIVFPEDEVLDDYPADE